MVEEDDLQDSVALPSRDVEDEEDDEDVREERGGASLRLRGADCADVNEDEFPEPKCEEGPPLSTLCRESTLEPPASFKSRGDAEVSDLDPSHADALTEVVARTELVEMLDVDRAVTHDVPESDGECGKCSGPAPALSLLSVSLRCQRLSRLGIAGLRKAAGFPGRAWAWSPGELPSLTMLFESTACTTAEIFSSGCRDVGSFSQRTLKVL